MGRLFDFAKFKANIVLLFRFGASFFQPKAFFMWIVELPDGWGLRKIF